MIELGNIDISSREVLTPTTESKTNDSGNLSTADQSTTRITETSVPGTIFRTSTEWSQWNSSLVRLSSIAEPHGDDLKLNTEKNWMWSDVGFGGDSPKS